MQSDTPTTPPAETSEPVTGPEIIARYLKHLGTGAGVYRMMDAKGDVIYVGKARNLKARVQNYARLAGHSNRIARMIAATASMEFISTATESEALLLEANLIKRYKPTYNVLMRDDKSFPYILISREHAAPQILKHRGGRSIKGNYFGPFASAGAVNRTLNMMQRAFLLRSCTDATYESRTRPCLLFQIKRCSAPCTGEISVEDYGKLVDEAVRFLEGKSDAVQKKLNSLMAEASEALEFERAAIYRNRLWALAHVQAAQGINPQGIEEADLFAAHQEGGQTCVQVFFFRNGQNWGNHAYFPKAGSGVDAPEVLDAFVAQFYDDKSPPRCILFSHDTPERELLAEALSLKAGRKVEIAVPVRGEKRTIVEHALTNAREALGRKMSEASSQARLLEGVAAAFGLERPPRRIEVFDNSHIQGTNAVGAMIVAGPDGFMKNQYRKFNIRSEDLTPGDDFGMMREVLRRRFTRLMKEHARTLPADETIAETGETISEAGSPKRTAAVAPNAADRNGKTGTMNGEAASSGHSAGLEESMTAYDFSEITGETPEAPTAWPDLVLIDGGAGQLSAAGSVLADLGLHGITLVGIAKGPDRNAGREHFFMRGRTSFMLEPRDPVLYFVQRLRDEAHRFAIGSHRQKRAKAIGVNPLDDIPGVGPARKRALLQYFGSAKSVARAGIADLQAVEGISAAMAKSIYDFFHEQRK